MLQGVTTEDDLLAQTRDKLRAPFPDDLGGGSGYDPDAFGESSNYTNSGRVRRDEADFVVQTKNGLKSALGKLRPAGEAGVIWLATDTLDLTGEEHLRVGAGVTLASGRGLPDTPTCTITCDKPPTLFHLADGARVTSLEIEGTETEYFDPAERVRSEFGLEPGELDGAPIYKVGTSRALLVEGDDVEIDNCVLRGFTHAAVLIERPQTKAVGARYSTHVHHCDITDNPADSLGYGVAVRGGYPIIEHCFFDNNRHSTAGRGDANCHSVIRYNVVGPTTSSHAIDMHGQRQSSSRGSDLTKLERISDPSRVEGVKSAGGRISIHHNVIMPMSVPDVKIRGVPTHGIQLHGNLLFNPKEPADGTIGDRGDAYRFIDCGNLRPEEVGLSVKRLFFGLKSPMEQVGPPGGFDIGDASEELKQRLADAEQRRAELEEEVADLRPKAQAADEMRETFAKLMGDW